jgi:4-hydroxy-tetrahydrodipicolinate synthase
MRSPRSVPASPSPTSWWRWSWLPKQHQLLRAGQFDEVTQAYYRIEPARKAMAAVPVASSGLINRMIWKYQSWLQGYNGGPIPHPTPRLYSRDMVTLRRGLEAAGFPVTPDPDAAFFVGRNPT